MRYRCLRIADSIVAIVVSKPAGTSLNRSPIKPEFNPELDGVRGLFMCCVFMFHCAPDRIGDVMVNGIFGSLWPSMDVFFALSGFLITRNLMDDISNQHRYRNFYANRALRIVPAFLCALFIVYVIMPYNSVLAGHIERLPHVGWFLTYGFNFQVMLENGWPDVHLLNHFWSVCVEEQFYFIWPLVIYLLIGRVQAVVIAGFFLIAVIAEIYFYVNDAHWAVMHTNLLTRFDSLGVGALLAFLHRSRWQLTFIRHFTIALYLGFAVLLLCAIKTGGLRFTGWHSHLIVQPTLLVWSSALVYLLVNGREQHPYLAALFRARVSVWLGKYSYGIYIYHWIIHMTVVEWDAFGLRTDSPWLNLLMVVVLTLVAAVISYQGLERWCLRLKLRGYVPRERAALAGSAEPSIQNR